MKIEELDRYPASEDKTLTPQKENTEREVLVEPSFLDDLRYWRKTDKKTLVRVMDIVEEIKQNPFVGRGRPERLKHCGGDTWSRRINKSDRLIYLVTETEIRFLQARHHYDDH